MVEHWAVHGFGPWAVIHKPDNQFIGHPGLRYWPGSSDVEVLYAVARRYWGKGLATEGARASLRYGFEHLKLERVMAVALVDNDASRRGLEKIRLRYEKTFQFHGLAVAGYSLSRTDYGRMTPSIGSLCLRTIGKSAVRQKSCAQGTY